MSYDLYVWKQSDQRDREPDEILDALMDARDFSGLEKLAVTAIVERVKSAFPDVNVTHSPNGDEPILLEWSSQQDGSFVMEWDNPYLMWIDYRIKSDAAFEAIIDMAEELGCTIYDPQMQDTLTGEMPG